MVNSAKSLIGGVGFSAAARRNYSFSEPADGSKLASYVSGQPRRTHPHAATGRLCRCTVAL